MENKKAMSDIISVVIIVGLTMVVIGIVWFVVQGIIQGGVEQTEFASKCLDVSARITSVDCSATTTCTVVVKRDPGKGNDVIGGVKMIISNDIGTSAISNTAGNIAVLATKTNSTVTKVTDPSKAEVFVYFTGEGGEEHICAAGSTFSGTINS